MHTIETVRKPKRKGESPGKGTEGSTEARPGQSVLVGRRSLALGLPGSGPGGSGHRPGLGGHWQKWSMSVIAIELASGVGMRGPIGSVHSASAETPQHSTRPAARGKLTGTGVFEPVLLHGALPIRHGGV